jgi:proteasome assembly chaperone (PAC2) family protein
MKDCNIFWIKRQSLNDATIILGIPGIGNVSNLSTDYLIKKTGAELVCKIESNYLPNVVAITQDSLLALPCYEVYCKIIGKKKIGFIKTIYAVNNEYYHYKLAEFIASFLKKQKIGQVFTIAGIAYKNIPKTLKLHCAANNSVMKKKMINSGLIFDGNKSVNLIIGSAGLLLTSCAREGIPGACILASTFAHPQHVGLKESREVVNFLNNYLKLKVDISDLDKEIKKINSQLRKVEYQNKAEEDSSNRINRYIG